MFLSVQKLFTNSKTKHVTKMGENHLKNKLMIFIMASALMRVVLLDPL